MKLLHLDSSITGESSVSRTLSAEIVAAQVAQHPAIEVTYHDLANEPVMHLSPAHLAAFQGGKVESAALGEDLARGARYLEFDASHLSNIEAAPQFTSAVRDFLSAVAVPAG